LRSGLLIRSKVFGNVRYKPTAVQSVPDAVQFGPFDYILVCSKAFPGTAQIIGAAVSPQTAVVLAQNGIGIEEEYVKLYPHNTIISGVVYLPVTQVDQGIVEHGTFERFEIGTFPPDSPRSAKVQTHGLSALFKAGGGSAPVFDDVQTRRWVKVAVNAAWNTTTALTMCDDANFLRSSPSAEGAIRKIMKEVGAVAAAVGYADLLTDEIIDHDLDRPKSRLETGGKEPSMLTDVRHGREMELEAIVGNTLRIGEKQGVSTPYLELLYVLVKGRNYSLRPDENWKPIARYS